ncbi:MAG: TIGR03663 family protein [Opitutaceae bacterium]
MRAFCLTGILVLAAWLRLDDLGSRPMHADEANQAVKLGELLERGQYRFDPYDHHGPTLYYLALVPAWLRGEHTLAELTETTVRLTPALVGTASVLLLALLLIPLGWTPAWVAALLFAVAPAAVYYSRYFVQETLLLGFTLLTLLAGVRWRATRADRWIGVAGVGLGLMQATKASAPLFVVVAALVCLATRGLRDERRSEAAESGQAPRMLRATVLALAIAALVAGVFYSSFLTHFAGLKDAVATYLPMAGRVSSEAGGHDKPVWYYVSLFWRQRIGGYVWDQTPFLVLVALGGVEVIRRRVRAEWRVFAYGLALACCLSAVPYKTPWVVIHLLPAGCGIAAIWPGRWGQRGGWRAGVALLVVAGVTVWQGLQVRQAVFLRPADPRNPLAYVHSSPDVKKVAALAAKAGPGPIKVISEEYWPLPWYLRTRAEVGYWPTVPTNCDGALVLVSPALAGAVRERLVGRYEESYLGLRPGVVLLVFRRLPDPP